MQIKFSILVCFIGLTLFSNAQHNFDSSSRKWSAGIVFSPGYAYRSLAPSDSSWQWIAGSRNEFEKPKFGYSAGLSVLYRMNKHVELESGLMFSEKGYRYVFDEFVSFDGQPDPHIPESAVTTYSYRYLAIPAKINWFFLNKEMKFFLSGGISGNVFLNAVYTNDIEFADRVEKNTYTDDTSYYKKFHIDVLAGLGAEVPVSERLHLRVEPHYRRAITSMTDTFVKLYCWSVGVNTAIYFGF